MAKLPLLFTWIAVLAGYLPYSLSFAFANPLIVLAYAFLAWPVAASLAQPLPAMALSAGTLFLGFLTMNLSSGAPTFVLPSFGILLSALLLIVSASLAAVSSHHALVRRGWPPERSQFWLRLAFLALAALVYGNSYLPYSWKMWIAAHTTNADLIRFSVFVSAFFVGTWRMTK